MKGSKNDPVLDNLHKGNWSSLDIFVFSNGQQYSPPRKYNLRANELMWWDAVLNHLARSQYGSEHSNIELYTIDGKKVQGPLELSNGAAYVAVEPPAAFIQSGYGQYLIKASRSWDKRQERRTSALTIKDNNITNILTKPEGSIELSDKKKLQDMTTVPNSTMAENDTVISLKSEFASKTDPGTLRSSVQQTQKKLPFFTEHHPSILRKKYVKPVSPLAKKLPRSAKEDPTKKRSNYSPIKSLEKTWHIKAENTFNSQSDRIKAAGTDEKFLVQSVSKHASKDAVKKENETVTISLVKGTSANKANDNITQEEETVEKDILSVSHQSEEHHQSVFINPQNIPIVVRNDFDNNEANTLITTNTTESKIVYNPQEIDSTSLPTTLPFRIDSKVNLLQDKLDNSKNSQEIPVASDAQTADSFVIFVSQGDTVNFKFNIQISHDTSTVVDPQNDTLIVNPPQVSSSVKSEALTGNEDSSILVKNSPLNRSHGDATTFTKSWLSSLTSEHFTEKCNDFHVICQCTCNSQSGKAIPLKAAPIYVDNNNYFILLPCEQPLQNLRSCSCRTEASSNKLSISKNIRNSKNNLTELGDDKLSKVASKMSENVKQCQSECEIVKTQPSKFENNHEAKCLAAICSGSDYFVNPKSLNMNISKMNNEEYTQTDWNNVLLEVRSHGDGRYSFHLPALRVLKLYNVL